MSATPFSDALAALAALSVTGLTHSFAPAALPERLARGHLPALLLVPGDYGDPALFLARSRGFQTPALPGGARVLSVRVTHLLAAAFADDGFGPRTQLPLTLPLVDAYFAALAADPTLGGALREPAAVALEIGAFEYGGRRLTGAILRHQWALAY